MRCVIWRDAADVHAESFALSYLTKEIDHVPLRGVKNENGLLIISRNDRNNRLSPTQHASSLLT
jgi:hypothetical protein